jgi:hypothetical protein
MTARGPVTSAARIPGCASRWARRSAAKSAEAAGAPGRASGCAVSRLCRPPTPLIVREQRTFDQVGGIVRREFHLGQTFQLQPQPASTGSGFATSTSRFCIAGPLSRSTVMLPLRRGCRVGGVWPAKRTAMVTADRRSHTIHRGGVVVTALEQRLSRARCDSLSFVAERLPHTRQAAPTQDCAAFASICRAARRTSTRVRSHVVRCVVR